MKKITLLLFVLVTNLIHSQTGLVTVGSNDGTLTTTGYPSPLQDYYKNSRQQYLFTASELSAAGLIAGPITQLGWNAVAIGTSTLEEGYTLSMLATSVTTLSTTFETGATVVYGPTDFTPTTTGNVLFTLTTPFNWDGTSNIIIELCEGSTAGAFTTNVQTTYSNLTFNGSNSFRSDVTVACPTTTGTTYTSRPQLLINGNLASCLAPSALTSSAITSSGSTIAWTAPANAPANGYDYYVSSTNSAPISTTTPTGTVGAGVTTVNLTGLNSATVYYVWARSICSGTTSSAWSFSTSFTTLCSLVTDFSENFESTTGAIFPVCWAKVGTTGSAYPQSSTGISGSRNLYIYSTSSTNQAVVSMPAVSNAADGTRQFRSKVRGNFTAGDTLEFGYLTNPSDATTFVALSSIVTNSTTVAQNFLVSPVTTPSGITTLALRHAGNLGYSILVDDVFYEPIPTCLEPTLLTSSNVTLTSATISWTASVSSPANGYEYYISTTSTSPTSTTTPSGSVGAGVTTTNLTGLNNSSTYYFWVRSVCSSSDSSAWSAVGSFTTPCVSSTVPYTQDFETAIVPTLPVCTSSQNVGTGNNWVTVNNPGYGFTNNTLKYTYSLSNPANAWFYTNAITLTGGTAYTISYSYGNNSTTYIEKMKVAYGTSNIDTAMTNLLFDHTSITGGTTTSTPLTNSVNFTPTTSGDYYFGFNVYSDTNQYYLFVDNIVIDVALANPSFDSKAFSVYPNPVKDVLNIGYNGNLSSVSVVNLLGQEMLTKIINADQSQINVSNLAQGTYLVKVTAENGSSKTIKIIKE